MPDAPSIVDDELARRYVAGIDGLVSFLDYDIDGTRIVIRHVEVPAELSGRGIAAALVRHAFERARADGLRVVPRCPYAQAWLHRHPAYADLVDA